MDVADRIRFVRKEAKLTQAGMAERLHLRQATITSYETGYRNAPERVLRDICREFGIREEWMLTGEGSPREPQSELDQLATEFNLDDERKTVLAEFVKLPPAAQAYILDFLESVGNRLHVERVAAKKQKTAAEKQREETPEEYGERMKQAAILEREAAAESSALKSGS